MLRPARLGEQGVPVNPVVVPLRLASIISASVDEPWRNRRLTGSQFVKAAGFCPPRADFVESQPN
jgi:hypothetical protein